VPNGLISRRLLLGTRSGIQKDITFLTDLIWSDLKPARGQKKRRFDGCLLMKRPRGQAGPTPAH
jgi:hypothetical protein